MKKSISEGLKPNNWISQSPSLDHPARKAFQKVLRTTSHIIRHCTKRIESDSPAKVLGNITSHLPNLFPLEKAIAFGEVHPDNGIPRPLGVFGELLFLPLPRSNEKNELLDLT